MSGPHPRAPKASVVTAVRGRGALGLKEGTGIKGTGTGAEAGQEPGRAKEGRWFPWGWGIGH